MRSFFYPFISRDIGADATNVVKTDVFLADFKLFKEFDEVYKKYFDSEYRPTRATVAVSIPVYIFTLCFFESSSFIIY